MPTKVAIHPNTRFGSSCSKASQLNPGFTQIFISTFQSLEHKIGIFFIGVFAESKGIFVCNVFKRTQNAEARERNS